jgi:homospermidine synthase
MVHWRKEHRFDGRLVMVGFGTIGQGVLPLLLRHIDMPASRILVITPGLTELPQAEAQGVRYLSAALTSDNHRELLAPHLGCGDFLLNLSVDVSSSALIRLCQDIGALYLDTCIEPWAGGYVDVQAPPAARSNYALREDILSLRGRSTSTAVVTHGANPGLVSYFIKQALLDLAEEAGERDPAPLSREQWAGLAQRLGVRVIHIAERDTQVSSHRKQPGEFVNTWSVDGFVGEGLQPAELGWGTHERHFPPDGGRHEYGSRAAIYLHASAYVDAVGWLDPRFPHHA